VIGVGVNLIIALPVAPRQYWQMIAKVFIASSVGIIARSLINEARDISTVGVINATHPGQRRPVN